MSWARLCAGIIGQKIFGIGLSGKHMCLITLQKETLECYYVSSTLIFVFPLAVIIISDCLCQQWLDRTHKVTNPIKLIMQVLNYTRKHSYPERRSAFTYIDEEQPTRMDYGKGEIWRTLHWGGGRGCEDCPTLASLGHMLDPQCDYHRYYSYSVPIYKNSTTGADASGNSCS